MRKENLISIITVVKNAETTIEKFNTLTENQKINFLDMETYHANSKPRIKLKNKLNYNFLVSLSHEKEFAIAVVVSEEFNVKKK